MLLTVNIGNSNVGFGIFDGADLVRYGHVPLERLPLLPDEIGDECFTKMALASVAPSRTDQAISLLAMRYGLPVLLAGRDVPFGIDIQCDAPETVGADRLLNAIAAYARTGTATIVADVGSAVTVDLVSQQGSFCGGAIAPGPEMMLRALRNQTERLPECALAKPPSPVGHSTTDAMRSGAYWGVVGLVEHLVSRIRAAQAAHAPVLVTGGGGEFVAGEMTTEAEYVPTLTLEGLARLT